MTEMSEHYVCGISPEIDCRGATLVQPACRHEHEQEDIRTMEYYYAPRQKLIFVEEQASYATSLIRY